MSNADRPDPDLPEPDDSWNDEVPDDSYDELDGGPSPFDELPAAGPGSLAPVWARAIARIFDMFIILIAGSLLASATGVVEVVDDEVRTTAPLVAELMLIGVWGIYEVFGTIRGGRMIGKLMMGLRVRQVAVDQPPPPLKAMSRWLLPAVVLLVPIAGFQLLVLLIIYLSAVTRPNLQGFHDRFADTLVVRTR